MFGRLTLVKLVKLIFICQKFVIIQNLSSELVVGFGEQKPLCKFRRKLITIIAYVESPTVEAMVRRDF